MVSLVMICVYVPSDLGCNLMDEVSESAVLAVCRFLISSHGRFREQLLPVLLRAVLILPWWRWSVGIVASQRVEVFANRYIAWGLGFG
jgi:hypothetical protein